MKLFEIEDYNVFENEDLIEVFTDKKDYSFSLSKFNYWLEKSDRLEWCDDGVDHNGVHVQQTGVMTIDDYWQGDTRLIRNDLYDYIILKIESEKKFDLFETLANIFRPQTA